MLTREINVEDVHLFETSVLGRPFVLRLERQSLIVLPCFNPELHTGELVRYSGLSYFLFTHFTFCSVSMRYYSEDFLSFVGEAEVLVFTKEDGYAMNAVTWPGLATTERGFGGMTFSAMYHRAFLMTDTVLNASYEDPIQFVRGNPEMVDELVYPDQKELGQAVKEQLRVLGFDR